jgi:hypothetical protein
MKLHTVFISVIWQASQEKYQQNKVGKKTFCMFFPLVNPSVILLMTDSPTYQKLPMRVLPMGHFRA